MRIALMLLTAACLAGCERKPEAPAPQVAATAVSFDGAGATGTAKLAHGERVSWVLGCKGCHTASLQGKRFYERYASNLTRDVPNYTDRQLDRLIRAGIHPTGRDIWGMPSEIFQHLSDADLAAIIAYLRTLKAGGEPTGKPLPFGKDAREMITAGRIKPAAATVRETARIGPVDLGDQHAFGRYITRTTCAECHGPELKGTPGDTPDLIVVGAYSREEFERLMTTGVPTGNRKFKNKLMSNVARRRFSKMTVAERDAVYAYLYARAERPQ